MARNRVTCSRTDREPAAPAAAHSVMQIGTRVACAALFAICASAAWAAPMKRETLVISTGAGKTEIATEIALTPAEQEIGLMFRTSIGDKDGMLFIYEKPQVITMWMHNTYVPLDMVFMGRDGTVSRIEAEAEPLSDRVISSNTAAAAVLELKAGTARRIGLKAGDHIESPTLHAAAP